MAHRTQEEEEVKSDTKRPIQTRGFYATPQFDRIILLTIVIVSLVMHIPPLLDPDITIFGQHWLFVTYPIGMVGVTAWWLIATYMK